MSRSLRRLMKEASELTTSPSPHFHAAPVSDENLFDWHFTLAGPPSTPYATGIYHGRITFPPTYPLRPPSFRFLTPSGRFEVNREICLSISGHHEETWQPAWGVRTALTAIRSFMEGDARGQVGGLEVGDEVRRQWAGASRGWCCGECNGGGKSNEVVLREWREYCVEMGVDVEKEEEVEGVPEGLRIGVGKKEKKEGDGDAGGAAMNETQMKQDANPTAASAVDARETNTNTPIPDGPGSSSSPVPSATPAQASIPASTPAPTAPPATSTPRGAQQQPRRTPTRTIAPAPAPVPVASQDSPWLDRAIFGVLIALVFMILRRVIHIED
ncbi:ubiquitin-conjugating enzyme E2 [Aspergillus undulatus]|uniref:ubiquitin-conjugating enzyme E2 n=1 Tax=Aspergillus undulatus TaxID=1810928 RepID=UPI003CCE1E18